MRKAPVPQITTEAALPALLRQRYDLFLRFAFREIAGSRPFTANWHLDAIEHQLHLLKSGENQRLIVTIPPRHLKTIMISVAWVAWMLGREPQTRFTCISYGQELADKHARDCLKIIESAWYQKAFPNMRLTKRAVNDFETYAGGGRLSTSVGGVLTGRGGDWIIIDDPMKADDALSEVARENVKRWFSETLISRADDDRTRFVLVMQRLHEDDLAGHLLRLSDMGSDGDNEEGLDQFKWQELRLPAIAIKNERIPLTRGRFHERLEDMPITPQRQSLAYLQRRRLEEPYVFAAHYQQDPIGRIGAFLQPQWFPDYDEAPETGTVVQSWDTAIKTHVRADWSVGITARYYQSRFYILDVFRKRVEFGELIEVIRSSCTHFGVDRLLIEDAASGQMLIQQLRRQPPANGVLPIAITPIGDKIVRLEAQANHVQSGRVLLPRVAPWKQEFLSEVTKFPGGRYDDQADALAQMLASPPPRIQTSFDPGPELIEAGYGFSDHLDGSDDYENDGWGG